MANDLFTFGYEGLSIAAFIARLKDEGVETVIDVRANPLSRKKGFSKNAFATALKSEEIAYVHMAAMGCPKPVRDQYKQDADWAIYTRGFLAYLKGQATGLADLVRLATNSPSCLVCFEADFERCHRTFVARGAAEIGGLRITHITARTALPDAAARSIAVADRLGLQSATA